MKQPEFLKGIHIGEIIRARMKQCRISDIMLAAKMRCTKWAIRTICKQKSIKINKLIELSYSLEVNFLHVYLKKMTWQENTKPFEDEVIIKIIKEQITLVPSKRSRTTEFLQSIHIGKLLKMEAKKQNITEKTLSNILYCSQSTVSRIFDSPDIDTNRLILMSYKLKYDFIRNIYLPYMAVNENEMSASNWISDDWIIKIHRV